MMRVLLPILIRCQPGDVLAHGVEVVRRAGAGPVRPAVIGEVEAGLRAGDDVVAVVRVDAHFADGLVLRELARRQRQARAEYTRRRAAIQVAPASVDFRMPWLPIEKEPKFRSPVPA